jgi:diguanylate cyclase (GGDEF)-like protein
MHLDVVTLSAAVTLMLLMGAGMLMLVFRFSIRRPSAHAGSVHFWSLALGMMGLGLLLVSLRGQIPGFLSIALGNGLILLGLSLRIRAIKMFWSRQESWIVTLAPALIWLTLCLIPMFYDRFLPRVLLVNSMILAQIICSIEVCRRFNHDKLKSARWLRDSLIFELFSKGFMVVSFFITGLPNFEAALQSNLTSIYLLTLIVSTLATIISAFALIIEREERMLREQAQQDPLTALSNRRAFFDDAGRWLTGQAFAERPFAVALFDLDHFKQVNDRHGHATGDEMLTIFAEALRANTRTGDYAARLGGEEFAAFLPDTDLRTLETVAERLRREFEDKVNRQSGGTLHVTVSAGIAAGRTGETGLDEALAIADRGLYSAKRAGRNCIRSGHEKNLTDTSLTSGQSEGSIVPMLAFPAASSIQ